MPAFVIVNGQRVYKPGTFGVVDLSGVNPQTAGNTGNIALVGKFPTFEPCTAPTKVTTFTNPQAMANWDTSDAALAQLAQICFSPWAEDGLGGAASVTIVNANTCAQSFKDFDDANAAGAMTLASRLWGTKGNQVTYTIESPAADPRGLNITLSCPGKLTESYTNVQAGVLAEIQCSSADLSGGSDTSTLTVSPSTFLWKWTKRLGALSGSYPSRKITITPTELVIASELEVRFGTAATPNNDMRVTVVGTDSSGAARTVVDNITVASNTAWYPVQDGSDTVVWSDITSVTIETTNAADDTYAPTLDIRADAYDLTPSDYSKLSDMLTVVNNGAAKGFTATFKGPLVYDAPADQVDEQTDVNVKSTAKASLRADLWWLVQTLNQSSIVTAERATGAVLPPAPYNDSGTTITGQLMGGTVDAFSAVPDITAALAQITTLDVQYVATWGSDAAGLGPVLNAHCTAAALVNRERAAFFAAPVTKTLTELKDEYSFPTNSRNVAVHAQEVQLTNVLTGNLQWYSTQYMAVQRCAEQAGLPLGRSPVNKRPRVANFRGSWNAPADDNTVIENRISAYTRQLGTNAIVVLSDVTTYSTNNNPVASQVSSNASVNTSIRNVRGATQVFVGSDNAILSTAVVKAAVERELDRQVEANEIAAYRNVNVVATGNVWNVEYDVAPAEPALFFKVRANVFQA